MAGARRLHRRLVASLATLPAVAVVNLATLTGCSDDGTESGTDDTAEATTAAVGLATPVIDPGDGDYDPTIDPARFTTTIDNTYLPLAPGSRWVYEETTEDGEQQTIEVEVLPETRVVMGVETVVVHDVVTAGGEVVEDTFDWFAQDADGNVWYFGEDTTSYDDPSNPSSEGSWEAGVDGALPGVVMPATPQVSDTGYRQEYLPGEAEDMGQVIAVGGDVTTAAGTFDDVIVTRDWTPLEPEVVEEKTYAAGVGVVREETVGGGDVVELVEYSTA